MYLQKRTAMLALFCLLAIKSISQTEVNTSFITQMNTAFAPLDKTRIPTGLLLDYAMEFTNLSAYNGVLSDTNTVTKDILHDIYTTVAMSAISTSAGSFWHPDYVDSLWQVQRRPGVVTLSGVFYNYAMFKSNAYTSGLITISNNQFADKFVNGVWQNPYQTQPVFAMSPAINMYTGSSLQVVLPSNLWFTNSAATVSGIAVNFADGSGFRNITKDVPVTVSYTDTGTINWQFKLTLTNGTVLYSQSNVQILPDPVSGLASFSALNSGGNVAARPSGYMPASPTITIPNVAPYLGVAGTGWMTISYANADLKMRKPLIVVEGFDPGYLIDPELQYGINNFYTFKNQLTANNASYQLQTLLNGDVNGNGQQYDIIYVDWGASADYLERNAFVLEAVIKWVNNKKAADGVSTQPNVVLGQSMGGILSRYALKDLENQGYNHQTRLFINWDGPMQGANVPMAYQHLNRHINDVYIQSNIPNLLGYTQPYLRMIATNALNLIDQPAPQEMLMNRALDNGTTSNTMHNAWQAKLLAMGYPAQCLNVAVSNGSECGLSQNYGPYTDLVNFNGNLNTRFLADIALQAPIIGGVSIGDAVFLALGYAFNNYWITALGILPGRNTFSMSADMKAQPNGTSQQIYSLNISYKKTLLWLIPITVTITNRTRNADPAIIPVDGSPGGYYSTGITSSNSSLSNLLIKYNISLTSIPQFNFVPTTSSLDIGGGNTTLQLSDYNARYIGAAPPVAPLNTPFANFTTEFDLNQNCVDIACTIKDNNEQHIEITARNGDWAAAELNGTPVTTNCSGACSNNVISGPSSFCTSAAYTVPGIVGNNTVTWSVIPSGIVSLTPNGNNVTLTELAPYPQITLTASITSNCSGSPLVLSQAIAVGVPVFEGSEYSDANDQNIPLTPYVQGSTNINNYNNVCALSEVTTAVNVLNASTFTWSEVSSTPIATSYTQIGNGIENNIRFYLAYSTSVAIFKLTATNSCGSISPEFAFKAQSCTNPCGGPTAAFAVTPNPAQGTAMIAVPAIGTPAPCNPPASTAARPATLSPSPTFSEVDIYDNTGALKRKFSYGANTSQTQLDLSGLATGIYTIEIKSGSTIETHNLLIQQ